MTKKKHELNDPKNDRRIIKLCGVQGCCPELRFEKDEVHISDDFGGTVKMTAVQFEDLKNKIRAGELDV
ncbi:MAG: hypothetical protein Q7K33_04105 [Candidatus Berkelbacteria bacterium]|nr:hypothetical protein [Candidatus Berkelbacteria bacterium]